MKAIWLSLPFLFEGVLMIQEHYLAVYLLFNVCLCCLTFILLLRSLVFLLTGHLHLKMEMDLDDLKWKSQLFSSFYWRSSGSLKGKIGTLNLVYLLVVLGSQDQHGSVRYTRLPLLSHQTQKWNLSIFGTLSRNLLGLLTEYCRASLVLQSRLA